MRELTTDRLRNLNQASWWSFSTADLDRLAASILRPIPGGWARRGDNSIRVGGVKFGADARKLDNELDTLSKETRKIIGDGSAENVLRAAAFFHLRFENIHPLVEANGRLGRFILAKQLEQSLRIPADDALAGLKDWETDYYRLFATNNPPVMFEMLLDLLSRITGVSLSPGASNLPASIEPLYPQKGSRLRDAGPRPEAALNNPELARRHVRQQHVNRGAKAFRRFF